MVPLILRTILQSPEMDVSQMGQLGLTEGQLPAQGCPAVQGYQVCACYFYNVPIALPLGGDQGYITWRSKSLGMTTARFPDLWPDST